MNKKNKDVISFKEEYELNTRKRKINECSWFGIIWGIVLSAVGAYQALCTVGLFNWIFKLLTGIGILLVILGSFFPLVLEKPVNKIYSVFSFIGNIILKVLIFLVYVIITLIKVFSNKKLLKNFGFVQWEESCTVNSSFCDYKSSELKKSKYVTFDIINNVLAYFIDNKMYIIVPVIIILLVLGMVVFFASSNAVFSFVYTLF